MAYDKQAPVGTPSWYLRILDKQLCKRKPIIDLHNAYYDGSHRLLFATDRFKRQFGEMLKHLNDNWCELVADAVDERMTVQGFRFGPEENADKDAWLIWQRNQMDAQSQMLHIESLVCAEACTLTWYDDDDANLARITVERADQAIVATSPGDSRRRLAGLKRWVDEDRKLVFATLFMPDAVYKWQAAWTDGGTYDPDQTRWVEREGSEPFESSNPLGVVPIVPFANRPRIGRSPRSELTNVIPKQDAANKLLADLMVAAEFGAFRQRWVTGIEIPVDPDNNNQPIEPFKSAVDRLLVSASKDTRFGEFEQTDLAVYVGAIEMLVQHIASQTRTPPHYFYLSGQFPSGESIKSAETGLVAKTRRKMQVYGEAHEETLRLALRIEGKSTAQEVLAETIWADPESRSESEHIDALVKQQTLGVPDEALWAEAGYTPAQIERFKKMRAEQPTPTVVQVAPNGANPSNGMNGETP